MSFAYFAMTSASAFESFPEFNSLTETEQAAFDEPSSLGPETLSDYWAYEIPSEWDRRFFAHNLSFDTSVGSLSGEFFLIRTRGRFAKSISESWDARITFFDERDYETDNRHTILELIHWWPSGFGLSLYGEPSYTKRENDLGLAIIHRNEEKKQESRLFYTATDLVRNGRNNRRDRFEKEPGAIGFVFRRANEKVFSEVSVRYEWPTIWVFPDEQYIYDYKKTMVGLKTDREISKSLDVAVDIQFLQKFEARSPYQGSSYAVQNSQTDRLLARLQARSPIGSVGLWTAYGFWTNQARSVVQKDVLPFVEWHIPTSSDSLSWIMGYGLTHHDESGEVNLRPSPASSHDFEQRLNTTAKIEFSKEAELRLQLTFDIDRLGSGETFEGGNGQFRVQF